MVCAEISASSLIFILLFFFFFFTINLHSSKVAPCHPNLLLHIANPSFQSVQVHEIFGLPDEDHVHLAVACIKKSQASPCITCTLLPRLKMGFGLVHAMQSNGPHYKFVYMLYFVAH